MGTINHAFLSYEAEFDSAFAEIHLINVFPLAKILFEAKLLQTV